MKNKMITEVMDAVHVVKETYGRETIESKIGFFALMKGIILSLLVVPQLAIYGEMTKEAPAFMQVLIALNLFIVLFNWYVKDKTIEEVFALQLLAIVGMIPLGMAFLFWKNGYGIVIYEEILFIWVWVLNKHLRDRMDNNISDKVDFRSLRMRSQNLNILGALVGFPLTFVTNIMDPYTVMGLAATAFLFLLLWERKEILKPNLIGKE